MCICIYIYIQIYTYIYIYTHTRTYPVDLAGGAGPEAKERAPDKQGIRVPELRVLRFRV